MIPVQSFNAKLCLHLHQSHHAPESKVTISLQKGAYLQPQVCKALGLAHLQSQISSMFYLAHLRSQNCRKYNVEELCELSDTYSKHIISGASQMQSCSIKFKWWIQGSIQGKMVMDSIEKLIVLPSWRLPQYVSRIELVQSILRPPESHVMDQNEARLFPA